MEEGLKRMRMYRVVCILLIIFSLSVGCKKEETPKNTADGTGHTTEVDSTGNEGGGSSAIGNENESTSSNISVYDSLIQSHTALIRKLISDTTYELYEGVNETDIKYINRDGNEMAVFFLTVNLAKPNVSMEVGTANDGTSVSAHQTVSQMISYKNDASNQREVIAATNGDYWQIHSKRTVPLRYPLGPVIKNGAILKDYFPDYKYYFLSIFKDHTAKIAAKGDFDKMKADIHNGLGGRYLLVKDGVDKSSSVNENIEPRTSVGLLSPTKVVFIIVDGRRKGYSSGMSMQNLAKLYVAIGATDAINLDGGGSTTLVVKQNGEYILKNKPSGNTERAVDNAWMILGKK